MPHPSSRQFTQTDAPASTDALNIGSYIEALSNYIDTCETPMTMAIQGDWGSGKTSLMNMVENELAEKNCTVVRFNTWQYSQFDMGDDLVLALMEHLLHAVSRGEEKDSYVLRRARAGISAGIRTLALKITNNAAHMAAQTIPFGETLYSAASEGITAAKNAFDESGSQSVPHFRGKTAVVERLREDLESYVDEALKALDPSEKMRLIVMIDDLDRLPPERAIEVMEALKIFLVIDRCVYVLAIDFDVVKQGVRQKFQHDFDERKAIAFFDKIIQVPFHMPVAAYDIGEFLLSTLKVQYKNSKRTDDYINLAKESIGNNPRSLKRLANTFHLLKDLNRDGSTESSTATDRQQLFATLCMQTAFPLYYSEFVSRILPLLAESDRADGSLVEFIDSEIAFFDGSALDAEFEDTENITARSESERNREKRLGSYGMTVIEAPGFAKFIDLFRNVFSKDDVIDSSALEKSLRRASVTSVGSTKVEESVTMKYGIDEVIGILPERGVRDHTRQLLRILVERMQEICGPNRFDVGIGSATLVKFYVDAKYHKRGIFCEIYVGKTLLTIKFGRAYLDEDTINGWRVEAEKCGFELDDRNPAAPYQVVLSRVTDLRGDKLETLVKLLKEAHSKTRAHFFVE